MLISFYNCFIFHTFRQGWVIYYTLITTIKDLLFSSRHIPCSGCNGSGCGSPHKTNGHFINSSESVLSKRTTTLGVDFLSKTLVVHVFLGCACYNVFHSFLVNGRVTLCRCIVYIHAYVYRCVIM